ncbi:GntP family permease [Bordetella hinzii]|uniref:Citrate transporter n=1 Tax=Bordetella hinzii OH87 BAL007II TaxID=1331262 RepID=A0ABR4R0U6_9BORD|nr:GntP family permease [Bordetella hinzii]AKQ56876.1 fructuronate transporter [Bordetella hinzii]KCB20999.1 citrate transporter [Bordetella hinzii L60]KCB23954.1 citrate transporter [Bordetella hinzii OH87 BAL007II]KCB33935.1 citrate transporter [Bordetella hinzii CA90 BAL1384]KCB43169.1 citrate transporter [Bordetella hinzii 5132]
MGTLAIVISLLLLMFFAYRGVTVLILAPIMAALAVILSGDMAVLLPAYTQTFMSALGSYVVQFLPIFLLGALFGQLMADSGAAHAIAQWIKDKLGTRHAILTVVLACAVLTYGGVSLFVVAFAVYPIAVALFRDADIPKRLIPASIALGSFTLTMTALPGTPSIQNAIPIPYFGTNVFAAPGLGLIASAIMLLAGMAWLRRRAARALRAGEGYGEHDEPSAPQDEGDHPGMPLALAVLPLLLVVGVNALFTYGIFPHMDFSTMSERYAGLDPKRVTGLWSLIIALATASLVLIVLRLKHWVSLRESVNKGVFGFMLPLFNTASEVGYGAVIASLAGFIAIRDAVLHVAPHNPLISEAIAMGTLAGITGSSSGGMSIALATLGSDYLAMAQQAGISPELLHRVAVLASGSMDTLPHSGAIITLLSICRLTHRKSYGDIAAVTIMMPVIALVTVIVLGTLFGSF